MLRSSSIVLLCLASLNALAHAQGAPAAAPEPAEPAAAEPPAADPAAPAPAAPAEVSVPAMTPAPAPSRGTTLRNGFSLSVGQEFGSGAYDDFSGQLYGFDWRFGAQISDSIAAYGHTHLSFGTAELNGGSDVTGNFAAAVVAEYTLPQRIFVGGGAGFGVINNPNGPLAELRAGWYPFKHTADGKARRLNVAFDARWYFTGDPYGTFTHLALSLGYDRF
jgi:hypothetical protein